MEPDPTAAPTPLWLSHHHPGHYDRCVRVGRHHVCRRCLVLYPVAVAVAALIASGVRSATAELVAMWVLPLGMIVEWVGEHVAGWTHRPQRLAALSAVGAVGAGVALGRHLLDPFELAATIPMVTFAAIAALSALWGAASRSSERLVAEWESDHEESEAARWERLSALVGADDVRGDRD